MEGIHTHVFTVDRPNGKGIGLIGPLLISPRGIDIKGTLRLESKDKNTAA